MKANLELILPKNPILFYGDSQNEKRKLKGILRVNVLQTIRLSQIEIVYTVKTHLNWKDESHSVLFASRMTASRTLRRSTQTLLQRCTLTPGVIDLEFEISIPSYLCPSFISEYCQIHHVISAELTLPTTFIFSRMKKKQISIEKMIQVKKTSLSKEVLMNIAPIPHSAMTGERANVLQWMFQTPLSVNLDGKVEFKGVFKRVNNRNITLNKIEIDVMQEELYYYDVSCTEIKRRLVTRDATPSAYIEPPIDTIIEFSFPLDSTKNDCCLTKTRLSPSLDSPFLKIRHFIRVILHINNRKSICIGLPIQVTTKVEDVYQQADEIRDELFPPTYEFVIQQGDQLPGYKSKRNRRRRHSQHNVNYDDTFTASPNLVDFVDHIDQLQQLEIDKNNENSSTISTLSSFRSFEKVINVGERSMEEFYAMN